MIFTWRPAVTGKARLIGDSGFGGVCLDEAFVRVWRMMGLRCSGCGRFSKDAFWDVLLPLEVQRKDEGFAWLGCGSDGWSWKCGRCALQTTRVLVFRSRSLNVVFWVIVGGVLKTIKEDYLGVDKWLCRPIGKGYRRLVVHPSDEVCSLLRRRFFTVVTTFLHR